MKLIDSHCHLDFPVFDEDRAGAMANWQVQGVQAFVVPGVSIKHLARPLALARSHPGVHAAAGIHPWYCLGDREASLQALSDFAHRHRTELVAIGECGLDKHKGPVLAEQEAWLRPQLDLAAALELPVIFHSVGSHDRLWQLLKGHPLKTGVVHGFSGSAEQALMLTRRGLYLGVGGVITRASAHKSRRAMATAPLDKLVLETDAPDMLPEGVAASHNNPGHLPLILSHLARVRDIPEPELAEILLENTKTLFSL
ncbi:TatD family hydrolase [Gallaecimonas sp. GXIMD4217]|uniref:TatD family hydrolase n=1 Tax=Gallaecimonas sp. GXIMD4217 TaxID=3131927 RepID=UPI00311B3DD2